MKRLFEDIKPALIEAGRDARAYLGPSLACIRARAGEFGVTLTWNQKSKVLLAIQHGLGVDRRSQKPPLSAP